MHVRSAVTAAALALCAVPLAGCASVDRTAPLRDFTSGNYPAARAWYEAQLSQTPQDEALDRNEAGTVALVMGDVAGAHRHFMEAFTAMEDLTSTTGEATLAMVSERTKSWKGDPYERCMNAYYLGVTYWLMGDPNNAAASFKSGLLRDADSEDGAARSDFAVLWFLMGMAQREASHEDRGEAALKEAHQLVPANQWMDPARAEGANVLVVLDLGLGPAKVPSGAHGADLRFRARPYSAAYAEVVADGTSLGRTSRALDVYQQAVTRGDKVLDHVNKGKAVFKDASVIGGAVVLGNSGSTSSDLIGVGMILAGILMPAEADVRQWGTLPGEVQVLTASLPPGEHVLRIDVRDELGGALSGESTTLRVTVRENHLAFAWARAAASAVPTEREYLMSDTMRPR